MSKLLSTLALALVLAAPASMAGEGAKGNVNSSEQLQDLTLSKDKTVILSDVIDDLSAAKVISQARQLDANLNSGYPIILVLNTPGGSIQSGIEMFQALKALNRPVKTLTIFAASMGFQTVQHLGDRYILNYGVLMSHKAYGGFQGEFSDGLSQLDSRYGFWLRRLKAMDEQTVKRTGGKQTLQSYRNAYQNELWLNGQEAVDGGYADKVVSARCDSSLNGTRTQEVNFLGMTFRLSFSECPLITAPLEISALVHTNLGAMPLGEFLQKGGLMQADCPPSDYVPSFSTFGPPTPDTAKKQVICALDKNLTVEKIQQERDKLTMRYSINGRKSEIVVKP
jgi:ATP-dependent Clp protease protease subunit